MKEYESKARPIFQLAGVQVTEFLTQRKNHVYEIVEALNITEIDAIVRLSKENEVDLCLGECWRRWNVL